MDRFFEYGFKPGRMFGIVMLHFVLSSMIFQLAHDQAVIVSSEAVDIYVEKRILGARSTEKSRSESQNDTNGQSANGGKNDDTNEHKDQDKHIQLETPINKTTQFEIEGLQVQGLQERTEEQASDATLPPKDAPVVHEAGFEKADALTLKMISECSESLTGLTDTTFLSPAYALDALVPFFDLSVESDWAVIHPKRLREVLACPAPNKPLTLNGQTYDQDKPMLFTKEGKRLESVKQIMNIKNEQWLYKLVILFKLIGWGLMTIVALSLLTRLESVVTRSTDV